MLRYVNDHYSQQTISLDVLAGQFNLSANYVSRFFKQETGCSFIQYITMLRMDKARELLLNTDLPIKDIVVQIDISMLPTLYVNLRHMKVSPQVNTEKNEKRNQYSILIFFYISEKYIFTYP